MRLSKLDLSSLDVDGDGDGGDDSGDDIGHKGAHKAKSSKSKTAAAAVHSSNAVVNGGLKPARAPQRAHFCPMPPPPLRAQMAIDPPPPPCPPAHAPLYTAITRSMAGIARPGDAELLQMPQTAERGSTAAIEPQEGADAAGEGEDPSVQPMAPQWVLLQRRNYEQALALDAAARAKRDRSLAAQRALERSVARKEERERADKAARAAQMQREMADSLAKAARSYRLNMQ